MQNALEESLFVQEKKLLITGATGFFGQHLTPAFVERGHRVVAVVRHPVVFGPTVNQVLIQDLTSVDWMPLLQGIDVVIHLAAIAHRGNDVEEGLYDKVNRQATAALAHATARTGARLIFVSSIAAQSPSSSDQVLTENDLCLPSGGLWPIEAQRRNRYRRQRRAICYSSANPCLRPRGEGQHAQAHSACKTAIPASFWGCDKQTKFAGD